MGYRLCKNLKMGGNAFFSAISSLCTSDVPFPSENDISGNIVPKNIINIFYEDDPTLF